MTERVLIVPAAGRGTRLRTPLPKALVEVNQRPMLAHIVDLYSKFVDRFVIVVSPFAESAARKFAKGCQPSCEILVQDQPTGMLDAILVPLKALKRSGARQIWITWCDQIAIRPETIRKLDSICSRNEDWNVVLPTLMRRHPYIHIERNGEGIIENILQRREGDQMPEVGESDMGLFALSDPAYFNLLPVYASAAPASRTTHERNFLPFITWLKDRRGVRTIEGTHYMETVGINTQHELKLVEEWLARVR